MILDRFARWLGYDRRTTTTNPSQWLIDWVSGGTESSAGVAVTESSALKYTPFWAAVRIISGTLAALPFKVYKRLDSGGKQPMSGHPVYGLLHDRPNEYMDAVTFLETRMAHVLCYGNGYAEIQRDGAGRPVALWPLLPDKTERQIAADGTMFYEVKVTLPSGGTETVYLPDYNVLHVKGLGFDGYTGYNVVQYHKEAIGYGMGVKEYGARFFGNGARPGGVLEHPNTLGDKALKHLKESWEKEHGGLSQAHRLQILEEGMKWHETGVDPQKAQALEVQKWTVDDCSRIFQIPPHKLGSMEFSKYNNVEQLQIDFICTTMLYWFRKWESEVNYKLFTTRERNKLFAEILVDAALRGNTEARTAYYQAGRQWGFLSINDIREKENMNPIGPAGDVYLDPLNMVPAGTLPKDGDGQGPWNDGEGGKAKGAGKAKDDDPVRASHRALLVSAWRRVLTTLEETHSAEKARKLARKILPEPLLAYGSFHRLSAASVNSLLEASLAKLDNTGTGHDAGRLADELMAAIGGNHATI